MWQVITGRWHPQHFSFLSTSADKTSTLWTLPTVWTASSPLIFIMTSWPLGDNWDSVGYNLPVLTPGRSAATMAQCCQPYVELRPWQCSHLSRSAATRTQCCRRKRKSRDPCVLIVLCSCAPVSRRQDKYSRRCGSLLLTMSEKWTICSLECFWIHCRCHEKVYKWLLLIVHSYFDTFHGNAFFACQNLKR